MRIGVLLVLLACLHPLTASDAPSLVIHFGGTYTGSWTSTDPSIPAVTILTSEAVVIDSSVIRGKGILISAPNNAAHKRITISNSVGIADNPGVAGQCPGRFLKADDVASVVVRNNLLIGTSGMHIVSYTGNGTASDTITVTCNRAVNIDGRWSDGGSSFQSGDGKCDLVQFCQLNQVRGVAGAEISWNRVENTAGASRVEDNISIYESGGVASSHLAIHDNYIYGEYSYPPGSPNYSGGGITAGDCSATTTLLTSPAFIEVFNNHIVNFSNGGIGLVGGHDITVYNNRAISTGSTPLGLFHPTSYGNGFVNWNAYSLPTTVCFNNHIHGNMSGMLRKNAQGQPMRADYWLPALDEFALNGSLASDPTTSDEAGELSLWLVALHNASVVCGPPLPGFQAQPADQSVSSGTTVAFHVVATGIPAPNLQWQVAAPNASSWANLANATSERVQVDNAGPGQDGMRYRCLASNVVGQTASREAVLHVSSSSVSGTSGTSSATSTTTAGTSTSGSTVTGPGSGGGSSCGLGAVSVLLVSAGLTYLRLRRTRRPRSHSLATGSSRRASSALR